MTVLLAGSEAGGRLFALCFDPDCVFEIVPAHGGTWAATFLFGNEPTDIERGTIEKKILELVRND